MEDGLLGVLVVLLVAEEYKREHVPIQHLLVEEQTALEQIRAAATHSRAAPLLMEDGLLGVLVVLLVAEEYKREHVPIQHLLVEEQTALEQIRAAATLRHAAWQMWELLAVLELEAVEQELFSVADRA